LSVAKVALIEVACPVAALTGGAGTTTSVGESLQPVIPRSRLVRISVSRDLDKTRLFHVNRKRPSKKRKASSVLPAEAGKAERDLSTHPPLSQR